MTKINKNTNASYNHRVPEIARDADKKVEPIFPVSEVKSVDVENNQVAVEIDRQVLVVEINASDSFALVGAAIKKNLDPGAMLIVRGANTGQSAIQIVPQVDIHGADISVPAGESFNLLFIYDAAKFTHYNPIATTEADQPTYGELAPLAEEGVASPIIEKNTTYIDFGILTESIMLEPEVDIELVKHGDKIVVYAGNDNTNNYSISFSGAMEGTDLTGESSHVKTATFMYTASGKFIKIAEAVVSVAE